MSDADQRDDVPTTDTPDDRTPPTDQPEPQTPTPDPDGPKEIDSPAIDPVPPMGGPV